MSGVNRISITHTRSMITAILNGSIEQSDFVTDPVFGVQIPNTLKGVNANILSPRDTWEDREEYDRETKKLARLFIENFKKYVMDQPELIYAGPQIGI